MPPPRKRERRKSLRESAQPLGDIPQPCGAIRAELAVTVLKNFGIFIAIGFGASFWLGWTWGYEEAAVISGGTAA